VVPPGHGPLVVEERKRRESGGDVHSTIPPCGGGAEVRLNRTVSLREVSNVGFGRARPARLALAHDDLDLHGPGLLTSHRA
jgi:hypothetical protein